MRASERARTWHTEMLAAADGGPAHGTRWSRGALIAAPAAAAVAAIGMAIAQGALAASFNVANQRFILNVAELEGVGLGAVPALAKPNGSDDAGVLHAGLASAKLTGLCILVKESILGVDYTISIGSGGTQAASGDNLFFDITDLEASPASLRGAVLGASADDIAVNGTSLEGAPGAFGLDVTRGTVTLREVRASAYQAQVAGALTLPNLGINVRLGNATSC
ncbi:MAG: DUF6230 family protein [Sporichthyaceae bacterium]